MLEYYDLNIANEGIERFAKNTLKVKRFPTLVYYNLGTLRKEKSR